jgi:hypothetical protein
MIGVGDGRLKDPQHKNLFPIMNEIMLEFRSKLGIFSLS